MEGARSLAAALPQCTALQTLEYVREVATEGLTTADAGTCPIFTADLLAFPVMESTPRFLRKLRRCCPKIKTVAAKVAHFAAPIFSHEPRSLLTTVACDGPKLRPLKLPLPNYACGRTRSSGRAIFLACISRQAS